MERVLRVLRLKHVPIFQQLCIEEALFYRSSSNWLLLNEGPPSVSPAVVLGISGKPEKMCNLELVRRDKVTLIKRFSGGGTVIVDSNTMFASLIVNQADVPECKPYPREIMDWSKGIYGPAFRSVVTDSGIELGLRENDYVFGDLKPQYRGDRDHNAFLTPLQDHIERREDLWPALKTAAGGFFTLDEASIFDVPGVCEGGDGKWMEACRTKFVGGDGKPLPPPPEGHSGLTLT